MVDQAERDALGKWAGLVVYRIDTDEFQYWDGANWHFIPIKLTVGGTTPIVADVGSFTTTETVVATTTVSLVSGRKYRVRFVGGWQTTVADSSITTKIREDNVSGTIREFRVIPADRSTGSFFHPFALEFIHTAAATGSKTFVGTGVRFSGTGTVSLDAGNDHPAYLYVEYVSE